MAGSGIEEQRDDRSGADGEAARDGSGDDGEVAGSGLSLKALEGRICSMAGRMAIQMHDWLGLLNEFDERRGWSGTGIVSCAHWLSWACSVSPGVAREYLRVARTLPGLPLIDAAFAAGRLSYSKVRAVTRLAGRVDEQVLLNQALIQTAPQLERTIRAYRGKVGSGLAAQRQRQAKWFIDSDGMWVLTARLPAEEGELVSAALRAASGFGGPPPSACAGPAPDGVRHPTESAADEDVDDSSAVDGHEQAAQILGADPDQWAAADALVEIANRALSVTDIDSSGEDRHLVVIYMDAEVMDAAPAATPHAGPGGAAAAGRDIGHEDGGDAGRAMAVADARIDAAVSGTGPLGGGRCHLQHGAGLDPVTALRLSCDAAVVGVVREIVGDGIDLRIGRRSRKIPSSLRRALGIRDGGCRWPGCHRRTYLQVHHVRHWAHGGVTNPINLVMLCRTHHMLLHEGGYSIAWARGVPGTAWVVTDPHGCQVPDMPRMNPGPDTGDTGVDPEPDAIRPGWRGEPFRLVETCGVLLDNTVSGRIVSGVGSGSTPSAAGT